MSLPAWLLSPSATLRLYRCSPGFWGIGITRSASANYALQVGPWVLTTEPA